MTSLSDLNSGVPNSKKYLNPVCDNLTGNVISTQNIYGTNNFSIIGVTGGVSPQQIVGATILGNVASVGLFLPTKTSLDNFFNNQKNISFKTYIITSGTPAGSFLLTPGAGTSLQSGQPSVSITSNQQKILVYTCDNLGVWKIWMSSLA